MHSSVCPSSSFLLLCPLYSLETKYILTAMGRRKLTKILLQAGCDPTPRNLQGETAMDIALRKSLLQVQEIIANPPPLRDATLTMLRCERCYSDEKCCRSSSVKDDKCCRSSSKTKITTGGRKREKESSLEGSNPSAAGQQRKSRKDLQKKVRNITCNLRDFIQHFFLFLFYFILTLWLQTSIS